MNTRRMKKLVVSEVKAVKTNPKRKKLVVDLVVEALTKLVTARLEEVVVLMVAEQGLLWGLRCLHYHHYQTPL
jgi:hypothetical protein